MHPSRARVRVRSTPAESDLDIGGPWAAVDWANNSDWDWHSAANDSPQTLLALWTAVTEHAREKSTRHNGHADLIRESIDGLVGE